MPNGKVKNNSKYWSIFNLLNDGISIISFNGELLEANDRLLNRFGLTREMFNSRPPGKRLPPSTLKLITRIIQENIDKDEFIFEIYHTAPKGRKYPVEIKAKKIEYLGKPAYLAISRDVTVRKQIQKEIFKAVIDAEEQERSRLAKELHDGISPILSTAKLYAQSLKDTNNKSIQETIFEKIEETINEAIQSLSEISNNLSPHVLQNFGVDVALRSFIEKNSSLRQISIKLKSNVHERLNHMIEASIYRVIIELMNNTFKHAEANKIDITLKIEKNEFFNLHYKDNGKGFHFKEEMTPTMGMGLYNIKHRIESLNGFHKICTSPHNGFELIARIPLNGT